jgi:predicted Ser/Thr protein kinase
MGARSGWWTGPTIDAPAWAQPGAPPIDPSIDPSRSEGAAGIGSDPDLDADPTQGAQGTPSEGALHAQISAQPPAEAHAAVGLARTDVADPRAAGAVGPPATRLTRIAQFVVLDRIGTGGMGEVFAAFDDKLERRVAIKLVATRGSDDRARQRLSREAQALARLSHPNVVTIYEVGTLPDDGLFIAMELVKGPTLREWQRSAQRTWREIVATYAEAGRGLAAAHQSGIVHRDFKPDNVLVGDDGRVREADYGIAAAPVATEPAPVAPAAVTGVTRVGDTRLTAEGRCSGTPGYMAPEQLAGTAVDARADQFSFCTALYEALHGALPGGPAPAPAQAHPRWLSELLARGLSPEPSERFSTMDALLAELVRSRERNRRRIAVAALGALVIAGAAVVLPRSDGPPPCPLATAELAGAWDAATRARSEAAVLGTGAPYAATAWATAGAALDRYAQRWLGAQQAACEATQVRHVQSATLLERRMECLSARRRSLAAAADVLQHRPAEALDRPGELLASLGEVELCADTAVLLEQSSADAARPASPADEQRRAAVRQQLASASALLAVGDVAGAQPVVAEAERLAAGPATTAGPGASDDGGLGAELGYLQGRLALARGDVAAAAAALDRAVAEAVSSHDDELLADAWLGRAAAAAQSGLHPAEAAAWVSRAEAWIHRLGHGADARRVAIARARAELARTADPAAAVSALSGALDAAEALWGKDDPRLVPLLRERAAAEHQAQQAAPAAADAKRALALGIRAWGAAHPDTLRTRSLIDQLR